MSCPHTLKDWCGYGCHLIKSYPIVNIIEESKMNTFPIKPLSDRVIVKVFETEETTPSGLLLPKTSNKFRTAKVMAVGRGLFSDGAPIPPEVQVGDLVQLPAHTGDEISVGSEKYVMITERVIVAVVGHDEEECCMKKAKTLKGVTLSECSKSDGQ
jgi:chaperonin GroES